EADLNSARAWYRQAPEISGAVARLRGLEPADDEAATADPGAPIPERQTTLTSGQTELYWNGPAGLDPERYRVEFIADGIEQLNRVETDLTAVLIQQPVSQWRVVTLRPDGTPGLASAWVVADATAP